MNRQLGQRSPEVRGGVTCLFSRRKCDFVARKSVKISIPYKNTECPDNQGCVSIQRRHAWKFAIRHKFHVRVKFFGKVFSLNSFHHLTPYKLQQNHKVQFMCKYHQQIDMIVSAPCWLNPDDGD